MKTKKSYTVKIFLFRNQQTKDEKRRLPKLQENNKGNKKQGKKKQEQTELFRRSLGYLIVSAVHHLAPSHLSSTNNILGDLFSERKLMFCAVEYIALPRLVPF